MSLRESLEERFISGDVADASSAPSIKWSRLGLGLLGSFIAATVVGLSEVILSTGAWFVSAMGSTAAWIEGLGESFGAIGEGASRSVGSWESFASVLGPAALPVGVALAISMFVVVVWVLNNVR